MFKFIYKQIPYSYSLKKQLLISLLLGSLVIFIMIFLQPFGTYGFKSSNKYFIFSGFGLLISCIYLFFARLENLWYNRNKKKWEIKSEIFSFILFVVISSVPIHFYNQVFLNDFFYFKYDKYEYLKHGIWFFKNSIIPIMLIILPFYIYLRNKFGELIISKPLDEIDFYGINRGEKITIKKGDLLFVKALENYVNIYYTKDKTIQYITFRNTLTSIYKQAPFLYKSHRSYLVNTSEIKSIKGNSQNAKIEFHNSDLIIPLSKSYYESIKIALNI